MPPMAGVEGLPSVNAAAKARPEPGAVIRKAAEASGNVAAGAGPAPGAAPERLAGDTP